MPQALNSFIEVINKCVEQGRAKGFTNFDPSICACKRSCFISYSFTIIPVSILPYL